MEPHPRELAEKVQKVVVLCTAINSETGVVSTVDIGDAGQVLEIKHSGREDGSKPEYSLRVRLDPADRSKQVTMLINGTPHSFYLRSVR